MAMVRKCDQCPAVEGVEHFMVRWDSGSGEADLCQEHKSSITDIVTVSNRSVAKTGRRRGAARARVTTIEEIEASKKAAAR